MSPILGIVASQNYPRVTSSFESIATASASGNSSVTFSSIPSTYQHLQVRFLGRKTASSGTGILLTVNGDNSSSSYVRHYMYGDGSSTGASGNVSGTYPAMYITYVTSSADLASAYGANIVDILDYTNTGKNKTFRSMSGTDVNGAGGFIQYSSGLWLNTAAITSLTFANSSGNFDTGTSIALYGIKG